MWRETNLWGIYLPPLLVYMAVAAVVYVPLRLLMIRLRLFRWMWNPPLAETAIYVCIVGLLVGWL
jgi:hypothetical protein